MRTRLRLSTFGVALAVAVACSTCSKSIEEPEARRLARAGLERYARQKGYEVGHYSDPVVSEHEPCWLYSHYYRFPPKHELVVTVDRWGKVELSSAPDEGSSVP